MNIFPFWRVLVFHTKIKYILTTIVPSFQKIVLTYVMLVINFFATVLGNWVTLLR